MIKIAYICDRKRPCNMYGACGNECTHTFDEFHTANGIIHHVDELETDRFRKVCSVNEDTYYEEAEVWAYSDPMAEYYEGDLHFCTKCMQEITNFINTEETE